MYLLNLNSDQFAQLVQDIDLAVLPTGMVEAHGQHCPLGTDVFIPRRFLEIIEEKMGGGLIICPEIPYGHSWHLAPFPGTIDIDPAVFSEYVFQVGLGLAKWGLKNLVILNGHGGNTPALSYVMERLADRGLSVLLLDWWQDFAAEIATVCQGQGHAGEDETSLVLAIDESLVEMGKAGVNWKRAKASVCFPGMPFKTFARAQSGDATLASKEKGEAILEICSARIIDLLKAFRAGTLIEDLGS